MDDSVVCGIRVDGELVCEGLEYALIRPEVVALRPEAPKPWKPNENPVLWREFHWMDTGDGWLERMAAADYAVVKAGVTMLECACLGVSLTIQHVEPDQQAQHDALMQLSHEERFQVIDGKGASRVASLIRGL